MKYGTLLLILLVCITTACAPTQVGGSQAAALPFPSRWKLVSFGRPGAEAPVIEGSSITLELAADGQVSGSGGCNSYGGKYTQQGDALAFQPLTSTRKACANERVTAQEQQYLAALETAARFEISADALTIWYGDGQSRLNFIKDPAG